MAFYIQDPDGKIQYGVDWADWGTLASATFSVSPTGPLIANLGNTGNIANCEVSGLTFGKIYTVKCKATLVSGEEVNQSITIRCGHK